MDHSLNDSIENIDLFWTCILLGECKLQHSAVTSFGTFSIGGAKTENVTFNIVSKMLLGIDLLLIKMLYESNITLTCINARL